MKNITLLITQIGFIALTIICCALVLKELKIALTKNDFNTKKQKTIFIGFTLALISWLIIISALSLKGFFGDFSTVPPKFFIVLIVPFVSILLITFTKTMGEILRAIPPQRIILLQSFRVIVEVLLWLLFIQNLLPVQMTFEGRNFDVLTGLTAPLIVWFCILKKQWPKIIAILWNVVCLGLLINIVAIAILSTPVPFRVFMNEPANTIVTYFPFIFLPGLLVPLAYGLHFLSLKQLLSKP